MTKLTVHFTLEELTYSPTAERLGISNNPPPGVLRNLQVLAEGLESVRGLALLHNTPLHIDSGYRCQELNERIGGARDSAHMKGWAADVTCKLYSSAELARIVAESSLVFDQLIMEGSWVHISFDPRARRQVLTAKFSGGKVSYVNGLV